MKQYQRLAEEVMMGSENAKMPALVGCDSCLENVLVALRYMLQISQ